MAFANLWEVAQPDEVSIDLMRYDPAAPRGVMDLLFAELMLWGRAQGYRWFNLGTAPLSGLERHPLAPLWHKIGTAVFDLGEEFYNFEGLYRYKAKFDPDWRPRYLASPPGLSVPIILLAITRLIAGKPGVRKHEHRRLPGTGNPEAAAAAQAGALDRALKGLTLGERIADLVAAVMGSWTFIVAQTLALCLWIAVNAYSGRASDPYPFILLNLALSFQAAYAAPIIMIARNRRPPSTAGRLSRTTTSISRPSWRSSSSSEDRPDARAGGWSA